MIRALVKDYDSQVPLAPPAVRPLRFRPVEEVIEAVIAAIADPGEKTTSSGGGAGTAPTQQAPRPTGQAQNQGGSRSAGASSSFGGDSGSTTQGESLSTSERDTQPVTHQVGKSTIIGDKRANSIIVVGPADVTEKVFSIIDKLDVRQAQVMIHTVIGELRLTGNEQFGLEYILRNGGLLPAATTTTTGTGTTGTTGTTTTTTNSPVGFDSNGQAIVNFNNLLNQRNITRAAAIGAGGFSGYITAGSAFAAALKTLESSNRFKVITRPSIFTSNNKRAVITSGEEVPVPTQIQSSFNAGTVNNTNQVTNSNVQFKPIELRLEVLPLINSENEVSLEVVQNISERSGTTRIDNNDIPNISRRAIKTYVTVPSNGTLILGGLIKESLDNTSSGIPRLVNLPLIGALFGNKSKAKIRTELIVLMRPVVTVGPVAASGLREKTFEAFDIPPDLESAIMPQGIREKVKPAKGSTLRNSTPKLRDESSFPRRQ